MIDRLFHSAVVRLTMWYVVILLILSLLFSLIVFSLASREIERAFGPRRQGEMSIFINSDAVMQLRQERIEEGRQALISNLLLFNLMTLAVGGVGSYLLARQTLKPIEEAMERQSRFSSDAAHELRTPLTIMQSEAEVTLRDKKAGKAVYAETLRSNLDEIQRLQTLTTRLLLLSEQHDLTLAPVAVDEVASEAVTRAVPLAKAKSITIDNQIRPLRALANAEALTDVIGILIDNAVKYSPEHSNITLTSEERDGMVAIAVHDQGEGIEAGDLPKVFDRFYRADASRSRQHVEGHGLGLSIARTLMLSQKGSVDAASTPGAGSVFSVRIPRA